MDNSVSGCSGWVRPSTRLPRPHNGVGPAQDHAEPAARVRAFLTVMHHLMCSSLTMSASYGAERLAISNVSVLGHAPCSPQHAH